MNLNACQFWLLMSYLLAILAAFNNCSGFAPSSLQSTSPNNNASQIGGLPSQIPPGPANPRTAYYVDQGKLYDPCGEEVILRGVNKMAAFADRPGDSFPEIAKTGANTVRFMWLTMIEPSE
ncbi:MAG: hypothetical protein IT288_07975, partial [Bdellovibrionales bacterium]|nr:hypothetical protein [Bdellovibrionales bacterium]